MKEVNVTDKKKFFEENWPFVDVPDMTDIRKCVHCDSIITVGEFKVYEDKKGEKYICCPNAPECNGTIIDWVRVKDSDFE